MYSYPTAYILCQIIYCQTYIDSCWCRFNVLEISDELHMSLVVSTKAHAKLISIDPTSALPMQGVVEFISAKDIPGSNKRGAVIQDENILLPTE